MELKIWDKKSPINGVDADKLIKKNNIKGAVYLILDGDRVEVFQYFNPLIDGFFPMTEEEAMTIGNDEIERMLKDMNNQSDEYTEIIEDANNLEIIEENLNNLDVSELNI